MGRRERGEQTEGEEMKSQCSAILEWLEAGKCLTPAEAYGLFGTMVLHSRVAELRGRGHSIDCEMVDVGNGKRVGCYRLSTKVAYG